MNRGLLFSRSGLTSGACAIVAGAAFLTVPPHEAPAGPAGCDCYVVTPATAAATAAAGTGAQYSFQVTNDDPHETLRSLTFSAPADFVITAATGPGGTSVSSLPSSAVTLDLPGEPFGSTFTVEVTALAPCLTAGPEAWGVSGVDSRGEANEVRWSSAPPGVSVTGTCGLRFTGQPAQTAAGSDILTGFDSTGSPLAVQLLDASGAPLSPADSSASGTGVTVSIEDNPGGGTLSGSTTATASGGVADFGNLQIDAAGAGYALAASASGFTPATSAFFTVTGQIQPCGAGSCSASQSAPATAASVTAQSAPGDFVTLGLGGVNLTCHHYNAVSDVAAFGVFNSAGGSVTTVPTVVTLTISPSAVRAAHRPFLLWQVCYGSQAPFPAIPFTTGTTVIGGTTYDTGLLLPCFLLRRDPQAPCLISRRLTRAGAITLTFFSVGDPFGRG